MANIRVDIDRPVATGLPVTFRSPADCSQVTGLIVYYPVSPEEIESKVFQFSDAHGCDVGNIDHLFSADAIVKVVLDVEHSKAYVQNADTNAYLESRFDGKANNPNLLDNWYFADPIDQRGGWVVPPNVNKLYDDPELTQLHNAVTGQYYSARVISSKACEMVTPAGNIYYVPIECCVRGYTDKGYTIDRWSNNTTMSVILSSDGITFRKDDGTAGFMFHFFEDKYIVGKEVTLSVLFADGTLMYETGVPFYKDEGNTYQPCIDLIDTGNYIAVCALSNGSLAVGFRVATGTSIPTVKAVKLELGSQQTLARQENGIWVLNDPPPDKGMELLKCIQSTADSSDTYANQIVATNKTAAPAGFGLGELGRYVEDLNTATDSGFYRFDVAVNAPFAFGSMWVGARYNGVLSQIAMCNAGTDAGKVATRWADGSSWGAWQYVSHRFATTATIPANWTKRTDGGIGYSQILNIAGIKKTDDPIIALAMTDSQETNQTLMEAWNLVTHITTFDGTVILYCYEDAPAVAIPILIQCMR